jgi:predicted branched-subunit amino acid permease
MKQNRQTLTDFGEGYRAVLALWIGGIPFALAYVAAARLAGISPLEIQLMSLFIFSAPVQLSMVGLIQRDGALLAMIITCVTLTVQNIMYGLSLQQRLFLSWPKRFTAAYFLTDAAYALTISHPRKPGFAYLLGAELSMYTVWNMGTLLGLLLEGTISNPSALGFNFAVPLVFLVLTVPMIKTRFELALAGLAILCSLAIDKLLPGGLSITITALVTAAIGAQFASKKQKEGAEK